MKLKSVVLASAAAVLGLGMSSAFADTHGLILCSKNISDDITVYCNGKAGPIPIKPNSCITTMPWFVIKGLFGSTPSCDFKTAHEAIETGSKLSISANNLQGQITLGAAAPGYDVDVVRTGNVTSVGADIITGTISKKN